MRRRRTIATSIFVEINANLLFYERYNVVMRFLVSGTIHNNGGFLRLCCRDFAVIRHPFPIYKRFKLVLISASAARSHGAARTSFTHGNASSRIEMA